MAPRESHLASESSSTDSAVSSLLHVGPRRQSSVSFDSVHVYEHDIVLGDNPSVSSGLPIALGCKTKTDIMAVDEYEEHERRGTGGMARILTKKDRASLIRGSQPFFTILKAKRELKKIKRSREEAVNEHIREMATRVVYLD